MTIQYALKITVVKIRVQMHKILTIQYVFPFLQYFITSNQYFDTFLFGNKNHQIMFRRTWPLGKRYEESVKNIINHFFNHYFWIMVLEKTLESPLDCKEIKSVNPKGSQPWIIIGKTEAEAPILWPPDVKSWLISKDPDAGKDWRQEEKGVTEREMVRYHQQLNGLEFEQTLRDGEG